MVSPEKLQDLGGLEGTDGSTSSWLAESVLASLPRSTFPTFRASCM